MEYRALGRTGISVSTFCLGTMMFGRWGNPDEAECAGMVRTAIDAGINFVDTADVYDFGTSEEFLGRALTGVRDRVVLATKFHNAMGDDPNQRGNSRRWIMQAVDDSLRRLRTDWIDLYQVHRPDPATGIDETLGALSDLVHQGKVRAIGTSTFPAEQLVEAQWARTVLDGAAPLFNSGAGHRDRGAAGLRALRPRCAGVGAAQRRLAQRQVRAGRGAAGGVASRTRARPLRLQRSDA
jgi:aryl-alcohol dehydrogenase-like predicted oxidoreductase